MLAAALALASAVQAYPTSISASRLEACATATCALIMSNTPMLGSALTVTGKSDGGTYIAGESISLSNSGVGQYVLYASAGGTQIGRSNNAALTITAPSSGTLVLLGARASGQSTVTYAKMSLTLAASGGGGAAASPPPATASPPPATASPPPAATTQTSPPPPPTSTPTSDPCFPSSAIVRLADGTPTRVERLTAGDEIIAATADGALTTDVVSSLSLSNSGARRQPFLTLTVAGPESGRALRNLTLTAEHHLPVGAACCSQLAKAKDLKPGDRVFVAPAREDGAEASKAVAPAVVSAIWVTERDGLHSPVLTHGGFPVVDGVITAFDRYSSVRLAQIGLPLLERACLATGTCSLLRRVVG